MKLRYPDMVTVYSNDQKETFPSHNIAFDDIRVCINSKSERLSVSLAADTTPVRFIRLRWNFCNEEKRTEPVKVLSDAWERTYADTGWKGIDCRRCMPWAFMVSNGSDQNPNANGRYTECFGVRVRPAAICFWQYDANGITLWLDTRSGGKGVSLKGRALDVCEILFTEYRNCSAFQACKQFYSRLCDDALPVFHKVYGANNWYYAYGESSHDAILSDTKLLASCTEGIENRPYMLIDSCWEKHNISAPWDEFRNGFTDMKKLADEIKALHVRPGIWFRPLFDCHRSLNHLLDPEFRAPHNGECLDPSHPAVLKYVYDTVKMFSQEWGYELIKHDFTCYDIFGKWGFEIPTSLNQEEIRFYDDSKTSAEIVINLYKTILGATGGKALILACNAPSHLTAGLAHINRIGDDVSGTDWERTRNYGVNTLAFRLMHHESLYIADADCLPITGKIDLSLNDQWFRLLDISSMPFFVSPDPAILTEEMKKKLSASYQKNSVQTPLPQPIDWMENYCPEHWCCDGTEYRFNWFSELGAENFAP